MNTDESELALFRAERRVREIQTKLHRWARDDPHRRFDDLHNLVADPAFLLVAWDRVRGNKGARTAGVDGQTVSYVQMVRGVEEFLDELRAQLRDRSFRPLPVRERMIPKAGGKRRRLGIAAVRDRVVQASLKLVLEPIFEADFLPCSYGFRPNRRTHDAVAEVRHLTSHSYEWIVEGDITACFDEISHSGLMDRVRERVGDKRVLALVKAFLKAGILGEDRVLRATDTGTPQGALCSAEHNAPYEQCRIMRSADRSGLVRAGSAVRALRIIPVIGPKAGEPVEESGVLVPSGLIVGGYVGVGGLEGFAYRFGRGACLDFAGEQVYAPEDVADVGRSDARHHHSRVPIMRARHRAERRDQRPRDYAQCSTTRPPLTRQNRPALGITRHCA